MTNDEIRKNDEVRIANYSVNAPNRDSGDPEDAFWGAQCAPTALHDKADGKRVFDLEDRTARFGEAIIRFAKKIPQNPVNNRLISQLVGAGTSVGANYCEADDAVSKKDFKKCIGTCRKESKETKYWLRMVATSEPSLHAEARLLCMKRRN